MAHILYKTHIIIRPNSFFKDLSFIEIILYISSIITFIVINSIFLFLNINDFIIKITSIKKIIYRLLIDFINYFINIILIIDLNI